MTQQFLSNHLTGTTNPTGVAEPQFVGQNFINTTDMSIWQAASLLSADWFVLSVTSGGGGGQDMQVSWTPTNLKLGEKLGFFTFGDLPGITQISFLGTTSIAGFDLESNSLVEADFPNLVSVDPTSIQGGYMSFDGSSLTTIRAPVLTYVDGDFNPNTSSNLSTIQIPLLATVGGNFDCSNSALVTADFPSITTVGSLTLITIASLISVNLPLLTTCSGNLSIGNNPILPSLSLPSLVTVGGFGMQCDASPNLVSVSLPVFLPTNGIHIVFSGDALDGDSVNAILARCVANSAYVSGTVDVSGGTNAAPTGQGITDAATLVGRGVTVTTN